MSSYAKILDDAVIESGLSYSAIALKCLHKCDVKVDRTYIAKLCSGQVPPARDEINQALCTVLEIDYHELRVASYRAIVPADVLELLVQEKLQSVSA